MKVKYMKTFPNNISKIKDQKMRCVVVIYNSEI